MIVPSYRRPEHLSRCLEALLAQVQVPSEILVVLRPDDKAGRDVVGRFSRIGVAFVDRPGVLAAMSTGLAETSEGVVAFTDDDAQPHSDWVEKIMHHISKPDVGGVGGRDVVEQAAQTGPLTEDVGRLTAWGRLVGNHHLGAGAAREVEVLKGVNMAFRRNALALPAHLRGGGAQVDWELATCLWASRSGWRLIYDPEVLVEHAVGPRHDADRRRQPALSAASDAAYNRLLILLSSRPAIGFRRAVFGLLVGEAPTPGLLRALHGAIVLRDVRKPLAFIYVLRGQMAALRDFVLGVRVEMTAA